MQHSLEVSAVYVCVCVWVIYIYVYKCACSDYLHMLCLHMHRLLCAVQVITDVFVAFGTAKIVDEDLFEVELVWRLTWHRLEGRMQFEFEGDLRMHVLWFENLHPGFIQVPQGILQSRYRRLFYLAGHPRKQYQAFKRIGQPSSTPHLERIFACRNSVWEKAVDNMSLPSWITHISYASESNDFVRMSLFFLLYIDIRMLYIDDIHWYTLFSMSLCSVLDDQVLEVLVFLFSY